MRKLDIVIIHDPVPDAKGPEKRDVVVDQVLTTLEARGHRVTAFPVPASVAEFATGLKKLNPGLVFNLAESFGDRLHHDYPIPAMLEVMGIPFTGADAGCMYLSGDKVLAKKLLNFHEVRYPEFITFAMDRIETSQNLSFPLFVKPVRSDASIGIHGRSLVHNFKSLIERVTYIQENFGGEALVEQYIGGREFYLSVLGHLDPKVMSVVEMDFSGLPKNAVPVASYEAKWKPRTRAYRGTKSVIADGISNELRSRLETVAREAYLALRCRDYGRIDCRVTEGGDIYVIEVNPNPYLAKDSEFAMAAGHSGIAYEDLVEQIVEQAWKRRRERSPAIADILAAQESASTKVSAHNPVQKKPERKDAEPAAAAPNAGDGGHEPT